MHISLKVIGVENRKGVRAPSQAGLSISCLKDQRIVLENYKYGLYRLRIVIVIVDRLRQVT
jgi:hypothetical protein